MIVGFVDIGGIGDHYCLNEKLKNIISMVLIFPKKCSVGGMAT
jgi:hypothetical protein